MPAGTPRQITAAVAASAVLIAAGWFAHGWYQAREDGSSLRRIAAKGYRLTSPLLDVELPAGMNIRHEPIPFKHKIETLVTTLVRKGLVREAAVYYRDLLDGPWFGINEDSQFNPASMMKVAVMIGWLKRAERDPHVLQQTFVYTGPEDMNTMQDDLPVRNSIVRGHPYTVEQLLLFMMQYSDNNATALLYKNLPTEDLNNVLDGMDIDNRIDEDSNITTVHGYSGFFRILFNASYLNRNMSELAIELLTLQDFPEGIVSGVPEGTVVASKFGIFSKGKPGEALQLHDFGIVYHPKHPYIIGIMTRGDDAVKQKKALGMISRAVYEAVDAGDSLRRLP